MRRRPACYSNTGRRAARRGRRPGKWRAISAPTAPMPSTDRLLGTRLLAKALLHAAAHLRPFLAGHAPVDSRDRRRSRHRGRPRARRSARRCWLRCPRCRAARTACSARSRGVMPRIKLERAQMRLDGEADLAAMACARSRQSACLDRLERGRVERAAQAPAGSMQQMPQRRGRCSCATSVPTRRRRRSRHRRRSSRRRHHPRPNRLRRTRRPSRRRSPPRRRRPTGPAAAAAAAEQRDQEAMTAAPIAMTERRSSGTRRAARRCRAVADAPPTRAEHPAQNAAADEHDASATSATQSRSRRALAPARAGCAAPAAARLRSRAMMRSTRFVDAAEVSRRCESAAR